MLLMNAVESCLDVDERKDCREILCLGALKDSQ